MNEAETAGNGMPGLVCTFYSYKGGVGRSMALANVGALMAVEGHRVLLIDWDLEAPGLDVFFRKATKLDGDVASTPGVIDLLDARARKEKLNWRECILQARFFGQSVDMISAGRQTDDYQRRVQQLDWEALFREHRIGNYIDSLREQWRDTYDFVLVDSRTGITDIGDICTVILPDVLVLLFTTTHQNVVGLKRLMNRAVKARAKLPVNRNKLLAVPVPARDERDREYDLSLKWQERFEAEFGDFYREWLPKEVQPSDALNRIFIPYVASWSFGERLPVVESKRERSDPTSLGAAYARLSTLLSHRLDWSAIDAGATKADVVSTRVELSELRQAAQAAETRLAQTKDAASRNLKWLAAAALILLLLAGGGVYWWYEQHPKTDTFVAGLKDPDPEVRKSSIILLSSSGKTDVQHAAKIAALLQDPDPAVRAAAATAMGKMGVAGSRYASEVAALFTDRDAGVRAVAADTVGAMYRIDNQVSEYASSLKKLLKDEDPLVRRMAVQALNTMGQGDADPPPEPAEK